MHSSHHKKYLVKLANTLGVCNSENMVFTNHSSILLSISITYASTAQQLGRPFLSCLYVFESVVLVVVSIMLWLQTVGCEKVSAQSIPFFLLCMSLLFIDQKKKWVHFSWCHDLALYIQYYIHCMVTCSSCFQSDRFYR